MMSGINSRACSSPAATYETSMDVSSMELPRFAPPNRSRRGADLLARLNTVVLLRILSFADAATVCRFSWTCSWAKEFVDSNIKRLPQMVFSHARIKVCQSFITYDLEALTGRKHHAQTTTFEIEPILSWARYAALRNIHLVCESIQPLHFKTVLEAALNAGVIPNLVRWTSSTGSFCASLPTGGCEAFFLQYLRGLSGKFFEAICGRFYSAVNHEILKKSFTDAVQRSIEIEASLLGVRTTMRNCFLFLVDLLKAITVECGVLKHSYVFPAITFLTTRDPFFPVCFTREDRSFLLAQLERYGLTQDYRLSEEEFSMELELFSLDGVLQIRLALLIESQDDHRMPESEAQLHITCGETEARILRRLHQCVDEPGELVSALDKLRSFYCNRSRVRKYDEAVDVVTKAVCQNPQNGSVFVKSLDILAIAVRRANIDENRRRSLVSLLVNSIQAHFYNWDNVGTCCELLLFLNDFDGILPEFDSTVRVMIMVCSTREQLAFVRYRSLKLLASMSRHMKVQHKKEIGDAGVIEEAMRIAKGESHGAGDEWCLLFNVTDEVPGNVKRFLCASGLARFWRSYKKFSTNAEVLGSMLGVLVNIAQCQEHRKRLINNDFVNLFRHFSATLKYGIEVSYYAAGALAYLVTAEDEQTFRRNEVSQLDATKNDHGWSRVETTRLDAMELITTAVYSWKFDWKRFASIGALEPLLELVQAYASPGSQMWALWALANFTSTEGDNYCALLSSKGGVKILQQFSRYPLANDHMKILSSITLTKLIAFQGRKKEEASDS